MLRRPLTQLRKDALTAVFRLLKRIDDLPLARAAVRLLPCAIFVGNPARLHLDGEDAVFWMQNDEIRLPLRRRANAVAQPAIRVEHRIIIPKRFQRTVRLPLPLAPMKIPRECRIESCHRRPSSS